MIARTPKQATATVQRRTSDYMSGIQLSDIGMATGTDLPAGRLQTSLNQQVFALRIGRCEYAMTNSFHVLLECMHMQARLALDPAGGAPSARGSCTSKPL
jgi:DNA topoisomerase IA